MFPRPRITKTRASLLGLAAGAWMGCPTFAQEPATFGVSAPDGPVTTVNDPLRARSATENTAFGRIVSTDEHRLTLVEGAGDEEIESQFIYGPGIKVFIDERPALLKDIPANSRVKVFRDTEDVVTEVVVLPDEPGADPDEPATPSEDTVVDSTSPVGFGLVLEGTPDGLMVASVRADGPAHKAGLEAGDEIVAMNETPVGLPQDILDATADMEDGATVTMTIRRDGTERNVSLIAEQGPAGKDSVRTKTAKRSAARTEVLDDGGPEVSKDVTKPVELGATLATSTEGIAVVRLKEKSPLGDAGLKDGDYIQQAAGQNVLTPDSLFRVLNEFDGGTTVELVVIRDGDEMSFTMTLPEDHERVLVDETVSTSGAVNPEPQRMAAGDRMGNASVPELQQIVARQQEQIDWLYNALMNLSEQTGANTNGWGGYPFGFAGGAGLGSTQTDSNGDGIPDTDLNGDGIIDEDSDGDGIIDDVNGDGVPDQDIDNDGIPDTDVDGDGVVDPSGQSPPDTTPMDRLPIERREAGTDVPNLPTGPDTIQRQRPGQRRGQQPALPRATPRPQPTPPATGVRPGAGVTPPAGGTGVTPPAGGATPGAAGTGISPN